MQRLFPSSLVLAALLTGCVTAPDADIYPIATAEIPAAIETDPMTGHGDRADDPAIWIDREDPSKSLILGTNKEEGLHVYDLSGKELQFLDVGRINNVDLRGHIAVASNDETNALSWFAIDPESRTVAHVGDTPTGKDEPYGICAGLIDGNFLAMPTYKDGSVQVWSMPIGEVVALQPELIREQMIGQGPAKQLEGCAFEDEGHQVFIGEEEMGIWKLDLLSDESIPVAVDMIADGNGLVADVEGVSIWKGKEGHGYIVASAQAANRFVIYDLDPPHLPRGVITITASADGSVDAVTHTDGLDLTSAALPGFPHGVLIVQDDGNPESEVDQNFKIVDWALVEAALGLDAE